MYGALNLIYEVDMFCIVDRDNGRTPVKSGFKTSAQANKWAKKNLPEDDVYLWGVKQQPKMRRYIVERKL